MHLLFYIESCLLFDDLLAVVEAALLAYAVSKIVLAAVGAFSHVGSVELPNAGAALISASLRCFSLRYCHFCNLLGTVLLYFLFLFFCIGIGCALTVLRFHFCKKPAQRLKAGVKFLRFTAAFSFVEVFTAL